MGRLLVREFIGHFKVIFSVLFYFLPALTLPLIRLIAFLHIICHLDRQKVSGSELSFLNAKGISIFLTT